MSKLRDMREAVAEFVPDGASVALGLQLEQLIPFAAGHEIIRQQKRNLTLIGPISDILFDQMIGAGCVEKVIAATMALRCGGLSTAAGGSGKKRRERQRGCNLSELATAERWQKHTGFFVSGWTGAGRELRFLTN